MIYFQENKEFAQIYLQLVIRQTIASIPAELSDQPRHKEYL